MTDAITPTETDHLAAITEANERLLTARQDLHTAVWAARHAKPKAVTWERIAAAIGISRQAAAERFTARHRSR